MTFKRKLYETIYPYWYGIKELGNDFIDIISQFKKPRTWSAILYATFLIAVYVRNYNLMLWTIPLILLVYFIRNKKENLWKAELYEKDINNNINSDIVKEHYERYKKQCYFAKKDYLPFEEWRQSELKRLEEKNKTDHTSQP